MNVDAIMTLLNLLQSPNKTSENQAECTDLRRSDAVKTRFSEKNDKSRAQSVFCAQNGIGEQMRLSDTPQNKSCDSTNAMQSNPIWGLLKNVNGANSDVANLLPIISSLMQKPSKTPQTEKSSDSKNENEKDSECNAAYESYKHSGKSNENTINSIEKEEKSLENEKEKTQRDMFAPVAFAGYEVLCALCALIKEARRFDR